MRYERVGDSCAVFATYRIFALAVDPRSLNTVVVQPRGQRCGYKWLGQLLLLGALVHRHFEMSHLLLKPVSRVAEYLEPTWMYSRAVATPCFRAVAICYTRCRSAACDTLAKASHFLDPECWLLSQSRCVYSHIHMPDLMCTLQPGSDNVVVSTEYPRPDSGNECGMFAMATRKARVDNLLC